jgi:lysozyme
MSALLNTPEAEIARAMIREHEGVRRLVYEDTLGVLTIGVGRNLERGLSDDEIEYLFTNDLREAHRTAAAYPYWSGLNTVRRAALIDMAFQLGASRLSGFKRMHAFLREHNYAAAATECLASRYAQQVPRRAERVAQMIRTGEAP